jgi:prephenate dehydratase
MTDDRTAQAREWAIRARRLEAQAMQWIYESETDAVATLARRTLAQATGLRRLLDQIGGCVSTPGEEKHV